MTVMHSVYREPGNIHIDPETCNRCGACIKICPVEALASDNENLPVCQESLLGCIACGHCMMTCPTGAIAVTGRGLSPNDLLPMPAPEKRAGADELAALMQSRRSVRRFKKQEVDEALLKRVVEMASMAPMGIPPWDVGCVTVRGREEVRKLAANLIKGWERFLKIFRPWLLGAMRPFLGKATYEQFQYFIRPLGESYVKSSHAGQDEILWDAPAALIFHHSGYAEGADATIACTYAMLAAESLGLGSTIIGGVAPILQRNKSLSESVGIPAGHKPSICLILGHPATNFKRTLRRRFIGEEAQ